MKNKILKKVTVIVAALVIFLSAGYRLMPCRVSADPLLTLTVSLAVEDDQGEQVPIGGALFSVYKVADLTYSDSSYAYEVVDPYKELQVIKDGEDVTFDGMTAEQSLTFSEKCSKISNTPLYQGTTAADGTISIAVDDPGMYLVVETSAEGDAAEYKLADPFLVSLPTGEMTENGYEWTTQVTAEPKTVIDKNPDVTLTGTPTPSATPTVVPSATPTKTPLQPVSVFQKLVNQVKTGDTTQIILWVAIIAAGVIAIVKLVSVKKKNDNTRN